MADNPVVEPGCCAKCAVAHAELDRLRTLINTPLVDDFLQAVRIEAAHQLERWGVDHDANKSPEDWLWLVGYLCTKASQAARYGDHEKHTHHVITAGAALLNWHRHATDRPQIAEARA